MRFFYFAECISIKVYILLKFNFSYCFLVLFAIPVATFGGVDRGSEVDVVAGAHVYPGVQWDSSPAIWKAMEAH
jgi:hypothetical protein